MTDLEREVMRQRLLTLAAQQRAATPEEIAQHYGPLMRNASAEERALWVDRMHPIGFGFGFGYTRVVGPSLPASRLVVWWRAVRQRLNAWRSGW